MSGLVYLSTIILPAIVGTIRVRCFENVDLKRKIPSLTVYPPPGMNRFFPASRAHRMVSQITRFVGRII